ncbi:MAG: hypothetical protein NTU90_03205 [Proteobacteria bacterium]|nr:hypothetical protein [Pseudomonadota bacterium]
MVDFQIPLPGLARNFNSLTPQEQDFIAYFSSIDMDSISPVMDCYAGVGPKGLWRISHPGEDHQDQGAHTV